MRRLLRNWLVVTAATLTLMATTAVDAGATGSAAHPAPAKPTIVLVHGAFADSSSWSSEIRQLQKRGYEVVAVANPLRSVASDTAYLKSVLATIPGPIVLAGHSYAGFLISAAAADDPDVKALVYVAAYIPRAGESPADLTYKDAGSLLTGDNLVARPEPTGGTDLYVNPATFRKVYAGGLTRSQAALAAVTQRPIAASALGEATTVDPPANTPKWAIVALEDNAIPTVTQRFMAQRAHARISTTHSGHDVPAASPKLVTDVIIAAAHSVR
ncbi:alpha/beta fold hydrolase [Micropruina sp.]|uniref:alpha/beta fold hydrolase n=1 Tax=Micropruina sp. TaxID=2737536 RepID=UPI0039E30B76